jgi:hypothetical protein
MKLKFYQQISKKYSNVHCIQYIIFTKTEKWKIFLTVFTQSCYLWRKVMIHRKYCYNCTVGPQVYGVLRIANWIYASWGNQHSLLHSYSTHSYVHLVKTTCWETVIFVHMLSAAINYSWCADEYQDDLRHSHIIIYVTYAMLQEYVSYWNIIVTASFICYAQTFNSGSMLGLKCITILCTLKKVPMPQIMMSDVVITM